MKIMIDRIVRGAAYAETNLGLTVTIDGKRLPGLAEGVFYRYSGGQWKQDEDGQASRRKQIKDLMDTLFD